MKLVFGGVRGSGPITNSDFSVYGGDTTSVLVLGDAGERVLIDAGSGLGNLRPYLGDAHVPLTLLFSHFHLDHLLGFAAFRPLYQRERSIRIVGPVAPGGTADTWQILSSLLAEPFWPIPLKEAGAAIVTQDVSLGDGSWLGEPQRKFLGVGDLEIRPCPVAHPGGCVAWRINERSTGAALVFATDMEWGAMSLAQRGAFKDFCTASGSLSALVMDGHFDQAEYATHSGWGHSTLQEVAELGVELGADQIGVTHHSPENDDENLGNRSVVMKELVRDLGSDAQAFLARQGQELEITGQASSERDTQRHALTFLLMVGELHRLGYQRLRIGPGRSPSGVFWRCAITHVANIQRDNGVVVIDEGCDTVHYSSGTGVGYFGWEDSASDTPEELAKKFVERFPVLARLGRGDDEDYAAWYQELMRLAQAGELPAVGSGDRGGRTMPPGGEG